MPAYGKMFGRKSLGGSLGTKWGGTSPRTKPPHALASGPGMAGRSISSKPPILQNAVKVGFPQNQPRPGQAHPPSFAPVASPYSGPPKGGLGGGNWESPVLMGPTTTPAYLERQTKSTTGPGAPPTPPTTGPGVPNPSPPTEPGIPPSPPSPGPWGQAYTGWDGQPINPIEPTPEWQGPIQPDMGGYASWQPTMFGKQPGPQQGIQMPGPQGRGTGQTEWGDTQVATRQFGGEPNYGVGAGPAQSYGSAEQPQQINQPSQTDSLSTWYDPKIEKPTFEPPEPYADIRTWSMRDPEGYSQAKTEYADQMRKWDKQNAPTPQEREGQPAPAPDEDEGPAYEGPGPGHPNAGRVSQGRSGGLTDDQMKRWNDTKRENQRQSDAIAEQERNWRRQQQHNEERGTRRRRRRNSVHVERQQEAERRRRRQGGQRPRRQGTYQDALRRFREQEQERRNYHGTPGVLNPGGVPWTGYMGGQNNFYQPQQQYSQWSY